MGASLHDKAIISDLVSRVRELSEQPFNEVRRRRWRKCNSLRREDRSERPPVTVSIHGFRGDYEGGYIPVPQMQCEGRELRELEASLRFTLFRHEWIPDDVPVGAPEWKVPQVVTGWEDFTIKWRVTERAAKAGSYHYDPVVKERGDLKKFVYKDMAYDDAATMRNLQLAQDTYGEFLPVKLGTWGDPNIHVAGQWCLFRGLDQVMMDMYDDPAFLHEAMSIIAEGYRRWIGQAERMGLLHVNNWLTLSNDDLPAPGFDPKHVRARDVFVWVEAQEFTAISPAMHKEFALRYERPLAETFGLATYGCCEDLTHKLDDVFEIRNLRQIGVTPWADVAKCAEKIGDRYSISWRPNPAHLAGDFDEAFIRSYLRHGVEALKGCAFHVFLKDIHSCGGRPERLTRWTQILNEEIERMWGG